MAMTPRTRSSSVSRDSRFAAPRSLNAPVTWRLSSFRTTSAPVAVETASLETDGVRSTRPDIRSAAASMSASVIIPRLLSQEPALSRELALSQELDAEDLVRPVAARRRHRDRLADLLANQCLGQGRGYRQPRRLDVSLVHADDLIGGFFFGFLVDQPDVGTEFHVVAGQRRWVDHLHGGNDFLEFADAALDEGLAFPRRMVLGVFRKVAVRASLGDRANDGEPFLRLQLAKLFFQPLQSRGGHGKLLHVVVLQFSPAGGRAGNIHHISPRPGGCRVTVPHPALEAGPRFHLPRHGSDEPDHDSCQVP